MSLRLDADLHARFKALANADHRTVSQEVRRLISEHVEQAEASESGAAA